MSTFILVHGAWHGAWCWEKIVPLLEKSGHKVIAIDLPGHGSDMTPFKEISLKLYTQKIVSSIHQQKGPVILVGHSLGGMIITSAAEHVPDKISKLVYLTAYVPLNMSLCRLAIRDKGSSVKHSIELKGFRVGIKEASAKEVFYHDCSEEDIRRAKELLRTEPILPVLKKVRTTDKGFGSVEKIYIKAAKDRAISLQMQEQMCNSTLFNEIYEMDTSHSPFYSAPEELSEILSGLE